MATRTWAGPGADDWLVATPVDTDTGLFTNTTQNMTEDFASISGVDFAAVILTPTFRGRIGDENNGWALECNGELTNTSASPFIHITAGAAENIERIIHAPTSPQGQFLVSAATVGTIVVSSNGVMTVRGDVTVDAVLTVGTGFATIEAGAGSYGEASCYGRSQLDVKEDPATGGISVYDQATLRVVHNDATIQVNQFGGRVVFRGGELAGYYGMGGVLDLSEATADVVISGSTVEVGPDLRVILPKPPFIVNVTGTVTFNGGTPSGWPGNYG